MGEHLTSTKPSKKELRRQQIITEAHLLFSEKGFDNTTVADIVMACGMARGTFYNYFQTTQEILDEIIHDMNLNILASIKKAREENDTLFDFVYAAFKVYFDLVSTPMMANFNKNNQAHIRTISYSSNSMKTLIAGIVDELKASDQVVVKNENDYHLLSYMIVSSASEVLLHIYQAEEDVDTSYLADFMTNVFLCGFAK
tara:strand:+ start:112 stop:708 length:597 start_codon:yes stop_codon:yes gene_type:complete